MTNKQVRDNEYYLRRLQDQHPRIYQDFLDGKYPNATKALIAAGMRPKPSALKQLERAWSRASASEREAFKMLSGCPPRPQGQVPAAGQAPVQPMTVKLSSADQVRLDPQVASSVRTIMRARGMKIGEIMGEIGMNTRDASLGMALARDTLVSRTLAEKIAEWVQAHASP